MIKLFPIIFLTGYALPNLKPKNYEDNDIFQRDLPPNYFENIVSKECLYCYIILLLCLFSII